MNTLIISNIHREPLIGPEIAYLNPIRTLNFDYPYNCIGQYRCWYAHTNSLQCYMTDETCLVFEDDTVVDNSYDWKKAIEAANKMVLQEGFEIACLHGRGWDREQFNLRSKFGFDWLVPKHRESWVLGTLCYVMNRTAMERFCKDDFWFHGTNIDIWMWSYRNKFCLIEQTPFRHGHGAEGSIIENPRNVENVIR